MKKITLLSIMLFTMLITNAQDMTISFAAKGLSTVVNFVDVKNLTKGLRKPVMGNDKIRLKGTSGINDQAVKEGSVLINPNPMQDQTEISFYANQSGNATIEVFDISGKKVLQISNNLQQGTHKYELKDLKEGIYLINIKGKSYQYRSKLISNNVIQNQPVIKYLGSISVQNILRETMTIVDLSFSWGDTVRFIGSNATYTDTIIEVPTGSKTIIFFYGKPTINTVTISMIKNNSAVSGGNITSDDGIPIKARGVCWSINPNPKISDSKTSDGIGKGVFTSLITGLNLNTTYYVRAYAINEEGAFYGNELSFTTVSDLPVLTTIDATSITQTTASSGGNIASEGGASLTSRGVCWSTSPAPTISNSKTNDGTAIGTYISALTGLTPNTTYYVRAYATNSFGTAYGNEDTFITRAFTVPDLTTTAITNLLLTTASSGGNITYNGGSSVTARGVCWSTTTAPTVSNSKTSDGTGIGSFTSSIAALTPGTTYYIRAYATNTTGTGYGNELSFQTYPNQPGDLRVECTIGAGYYYGNVDVYIYKTAADRSNDVTRKNYFKHSITSASYGALFSSILPQQYYIYCNMAGTYFGTDDIFVMPNTETKITINLSK
jgi:hypothetical protein